jgi:AhpD family alkylhydroperoxidase
MSPPEESAHIYNPAVAELVAIGAAIAANCEPCFKYHFTQARKLGATPKDIALSVAMAAAVKEAPARAILDLAEKFTGGKASCEESGVPPQGTCCSKTAK